MDLTKFKNNNLLKVGAAAILSIGVLSACGDDEDPVIDNNDDVDIDQPADTTPNDDVDMDQPADTAPNDDVDMEPDTDVDMDVETNDEEDGDTKATN